MKRVKVRSGVFVSERINCNDPRKIPQAIKESLSTFTLEHVLQDIEIQARKILFDAGLITSKGTWRKVSEKRLSSIKSTGRLQPSLTMSSRTEAIRIYSGIQG
jgi:hypothetical protein